MSSVDFKKHTFTSGTAMVGHFTRYDGREGVEYRNKYIRPELSEQNYVVGARFGIVPTSERIMERLRERVREVDEIQPPRRRAKNRVTVMTYTIAAPEGLTDAQEREFFRVVHEELAKMSGGRQNVSPGFVHRDEVHEYVGTSGETVKSRAHMHVAGIPYTAEKGVNGKSFETRERMRELNRVIDERCRKELGFRFLTGEKGLTGRSVEELQAASETRAKRKARALLNAELADKRQAVRDLQDVVSSLERQNAVLERQNAALSVSVDEKGRFIEDAEKTLSDASERIRGVQQEVEQLRLELGSLERIRQFCVERIRALYERGKRVLSAFSRLRETVESGARNTVIESDDVGTKSYRLKGGKEVYAPTVKKTGELITWGDKVPLYEHGDTSRPGHELFTPAYVMDGSGRLKPADGRTFGTPGAWSEAFTPERRTLRQTERDSSDRVVLSDRLRDEVDRCQSIIADIDRLEGKERQATHGREERRQGTVR